MSKEKIYDIEKRVVSRTLITIPERDYTYLKKQAERVQELEGYLELRDGVYRENIYRMEKEYKLFDRIASLEQQNKRYKELIDTIIYRLVTRDAYDTKTVIEAIQIDVKEFVEGDEQ